MKNKLFLIFALVCLGFFACRKISPHDLPSNGSVSPPHCHNFVKDGDEESIDCGGSCDACTFVTAPCTNTVNNVSFSAGFPTLPTTTFASSGVTKGVVGSSYQIEATSGSTVLTFTFASTSITPNQVFTAVSGSAFSSNEVSINLSCAGYTFTGSAGGQVYLNEIGGKYVLDFCAINIFTWSGGGITKTMTGNITTN